jgi:hypothetical protein
VKSDTGCLLLIIVIGVAMFLLAWFPGLFGL